MSSGSFHAVFLHPGAIEALGAAIAPYLNDGPHGRHVVCREIDPGGPFFGMTIAGTTNDGRAVELDLMIPANMVLMVLSAHGEGGFGFQQGSAPAESTPPAHGGAMAAGPASTGAVADDPPPSAQGDRWSSLEG